MKYNIRTNQEWFFVGHGIIVATLLVLPAAVTYLNWSTFLRVTIGVAIVELIALVISLWAPFKVRQWWHAIWGILIAPVGMVMMVRFGHIAIEGSDLPFNLLVYGLQNISDLQVLVVSEAPFWVWSGIFVWLAIGIAIGLWGGGVVGRRHNRMADALMSGSFVVVVAFLVSQIVTFPVVSGQGVGNASGAKDDTSAVRSITPVHVKSTPDTTFDNVVVIVLESTRMDAINPYNAERTTTPFLQKIADEGLLVEKAYTTQAHTTKGLVSILCGIPGATHTGIIESKEGGIPHDCLPNLLQPIGYRTGFFQPAGRRFENREGLAKNMGFDHFIALSDLDQEKWLPTNYFGIEERALFDPIFNWVDEKEDPFFMSILTLTSHHYFRTPATFEKKLYSDDKLQNDYLNTVNYVDGFLEELFDKFEQRGLLDSTLFVFVADHGEGLNTHDDAGHHNLYEESIRVPLLLWGKGFGKPGTVTGLRQQADIMPTILEALQLQVSGTLFGQSLLQPSSREVIFAQCFLSKCEGRITESEKLITYSNGKTISFNLEKDPGELHSSVLEIPTETIREYENQINDWQQAVTDLYTKKASPSPTE